MKAYCNSKKCTGKQYSSRGVEKEFNHDQICRDCGHVLVIKKDRTKKIHNVTSQGMNKFKMLARTA